MGRVTEDRIEVIKVELNREDVTAACIAYARENLKGQSRDYGVDEAWKPQVIEDQYGGRIIFFGKKAKGDDR